MTDARYPEAWLNDRRIVRLSDPGHRLYVTTLAWSASNRTDGLIESADLALIHGVDPSKATELVEARLWKQVPGGYLVLDFAKTQSTKAQLEGLEHKRLSDRERKARERARKNGSPDPESEDQSGGHVTRDIRRDVQRDTKARTGQEGQASTEADSEQTDDRDAWPPVVSASSSLRSSSSSSRSCSACSGPLVGPLSIAEGTCAECDNERARRSA